MLTTPARRLAAVSLVGALAALPLRSSEAPEGAGVAAHPRVAEALALLEEWVEAERAYRDIPGVSMALVHGDEVFWSRGFGSAHRDPGIAAAPDTLYSICSISKLFTAIGVMQLRDQGRVRLDEPLAAYLPWFEIAQPHAGSPEITLRGVLTHSSGLPRESAHAYWTGPDFPFPARDEMIAGLRDQETLYPAERYFQYSNLGLTLAGEVVAAVSGMPYEDYVRAHILEPIGLSDTTPRLPGEERGGRLATGYARQRREGEREALPFFETAAIAPAAGFASTALDLARFAAWQLRLLEGGGEDVLRAATLREMHRVHWMDPDWKTSWGLGFVVRREGDTTMVGHGGSCPGYRTELAIAPSERFAVAFLANAIDAPTSLFVRGAHELVGPALRDIAKAERAEKSGSAAAPAQDPGVQAPASVVSPDAPAFDPSLYAGLYQSVWGEAVVVPWEGGLAMMRLPAEEPRRALEKLRHVEGHTFRRVRDDGELGEAVVFELDARGAVARTRRHGNAMEKVR